MALLGHKRYDIISLRFLFFGVVLAAELQSVRLHAGGVVGCVVAAASVAAVCFPIGAVFGTSVRRATVRTVLIDCLPARLLCFSSLRYRLRESRI